MQRGIKFRGKRVDTGEWVYGNLLKLESGFFTDNNGKAYECYIIPEITNGSWIKSKLMLKFISPCFEVIPETVSQYTGLKDKNGKEIYEGDIYHQGDKNILYVVVWHDTLFIGKQVRANSYAGLSYWLDRIEVIGNIFENSDLIDNPELLQEVE